ncbi:MAG: glycosyltransferase family 2 protein [Candidatus Brocadiaceae bacterium]|nr:glycosyltransferase family 2 protein [Candidatus Brocadiaceae bacterium]
MKKVDVSIVICTHRRFDLLVGAVQSLVVQSSSPATFEVIVVDNDHKPNPEVQKIVSNVSSKIQIRYLHESKLGLSHARNAGGKIATSDYIGYMDDDAKANPKYIETLLNVLHEHSPDICGGPHYPFYLGQKPDWFHDSYGTGTRGDVARCLTTNEYLDGGNIIFHRSVLKQTGWFDPALGMTGKKVWYGEETMVIIRARKLMKDLIVYYDPDVYVQHLVPTRKMSILNKFKKEFQTGRSQIYFWIPEKELQGYRSKAPVNVIRILLSTLFKIIQQLISRDRSRYPFIQNFLFEEVSKSFTALGEQLTLTIDSFLAKRTKSRIR